MGGAATVEKALDVLFHLHGAGGAQGLTEIGQALDLPKSSCHRLLSSLVDREVVERDAGGRYRPGLALLSLGMGAQSREPVVRAARPLLERQARAFGETVFLVGLRHARLRVLDRVEGSGFLRAAPDIGDIVPMDTTAAGQLYRAFGEQEGPGDRDPSDGDSRSTDSQLRAPDLEDEDLARIRRDGFAVNRDHWIPGLSVLAVPIWRGVHASGPRPEEQMVAVLALAAASPRFETLGETRVAEALLVAATEIAVRLGGATANMNRSSRMEERRDGTT